MTEAVQKFIPIFVGALLILRGLYWIVDGKHGNKRSYFFGIAAIIAEIESIWNSVFGMCGLFQSTAVEFSKKQNFSYDFEQAKNSLNFLQHVRKLPVNAKEIYP